MGRTDASSVSRSPLFHTRLLHHIKARRTQVSLERETIHTSRLLGPPFSTRLLHLAREPINLQRPRTDSPSIAAIEHHATTQLSKNIIDLPPLPSRRTLPYIDPRDTDFSIHLLSFFYPKSSSHHQKRRAFWSPITSALAQALFDRPSSFNS